LSKRSPKYSRHRNGEQQGDEQTMMLAVTLAIEIKASARSNNWNGKYIITFMVPKYYTSK